MAVHVDDVGGVLLCAGGDQQVRYGNAMAAVAREIALRRFAVAKVSASMRNSRKCSRSSSSRA